MKCCLLRLVFLFCNSFKIHKNTQIREDLQEKRLLNIFQFEICRVEQNADASGSCRSRRALASEFVNGEIGFDTAESEPSKVSWKVEGSQRKHQGTAGARSAETITGLQTTIAEMEAALQAAQGEGEMLPATACLSFL